MSTILCIRDLHVPYHHPGAFDFLADLARRHKPDTIDCLGDEVDAYAFSRFPKGPDRADAGGAAALAGEGAL